MLNIVKADVSCVKLTPARRKAVVKAIGSKKRKESDGVPVRGVKTRAPQDLN